MKLYKFSGLLLLLILIFSISACEDNTTTIGSSIATGEVEISIDTFYFNLNAKPVEIKNFDSKTGNLMIGRIQVKEYGNLDCAFVTRLMCVPQLDVPDSLLNPERVDSCKIVIAAERDNIIGDSLAPQKFEIYPLIKQLPSAIDNNFDPTGYYDPSSPIAIKSYTLSNIAQSDSAFYNNSYIELSVDLPVSFGREVFEKYINDPAIFEWPQTMAQEFLPGLYFKPTFGNGCIANINTIFIGIYYHSLEEVTEENDDGEEITKVQKVNNVTYPFTVSPEVLSSNTISYMPSQDVVDQNETATDNVVITTPGGYIATFSFPAQDLIDRYKENNTHLSTVNELTLFIPAEPYMEDSGIGVAQNLLMIKSSEYEDFFAKNKTPDNISSFTGIYDSNNKLYYFSTMRNYFLDLLTKDTLSQEDLEFTLIPVEIETETVNSYYSEATTYVTKCVPYTARPTMTLLHTGDAMVTFSFSTQLID